jgi:hypothetical protein
MAQFHPMAHEKSSFPSDSSLAREREARLFADLKELDHGLFGTGRSHPFSGFFGNFCG